MDLLEVASTSSEGGDDGGRDGVLGQRLVHPGAATDVHQVDRGAVGVIEVRTVDSAQPVEAVSVARPHKRPDGHVGEAFDAPGCLGFGVKRIAEPAEATS